MSVNIKGCSVKTPLEKLPQIIVVYIDVANGFLKNKMYAIHEEMCLGNFCLRSTKEFDVHRTIHVNKAGRKIVTLESIDVCCTAWYTIHDVSKTEFSRQSCLCQGMPPVPSPWECGLKETYGSNNTSNFHYGDHRCPPCRCNAVQNTLTHTFTTGEKVMDKVLSTCIK